MRHFVNFRFRASPSHLAIFVLVLAICWEVNAAPSPQSSSDNFTDMIRRGFMRIISIPAQTLNMFFRNGQDGGEFSGGGSSGGSVSGRAQETGVRDATVSGLASQS